MNALQQSQEVTQKVVVSKRADLTSEVILLELKRADGGELPAWAPGSHIDLNLPNGLIRQYSLCGDPADRTTYSVGVFREPAGRGGSAYIHDSVHEGDEIEIKGPRNHFAFTPGERVIFIGGGIGITPLIPMMNEAVARGLEFELHYGGRSRSTMAYADDLVEQFGADRVSLIPQDELGLIDLPAILGTPDDRTTVYSCGPAPMLDAVEKNCEKWPTGALHIERFAAKDIDTTGDTEFEVELTDSGLTLTIPADRSILDILDDNNIPIPSSCRDGTCGSCETFVTEGIPDHRDSVLSDAEKEKNDCMMVCVSRSKTPRLVLEA